MESFLGINLVALIQAVGYIGLTAIIFAESGLFIGFFLPGDSLLVTAGLLASQGYFHFPLLVILMFAAAVLGDSFGYYFGKRVGPKIFSREDSFLFRRSHVAHAEAFYARHGGKTLILARFIPVVRTFAPILAGVGGMSYGRFLSYNVFGGLIWGAGLTAAGYYLGTYVPGIDRYILLVIAAIIIVSIIPPAWHVLRDPDERRSILAALKKLIHRR